MVAAHAHAQDKSIPFIQSHAAISTISISGIAYAPRWLNGSELTADAPACTYRY